MGFCDLSCLCDSVFLFPSAALRALCVSAVQLVSRFRSSWTSGARRVMASRMTGAG